MTKKPKKVVDAEETAAPQASSQDSLAINPHDAAYDGADNNSGAENPHEQPSED